MQKKSYTGWCDSVFKYASRPKIAKKTLKSVFFRFQDCQYFEHLKSLSAMLVTVSSKSVDGLCRLIVKIDPLINWC